MRNKHRTFDPSFKAQVALEALRERRTLSELANEHNLHPKMIGDWKQIIQQQSYALFADGRKKRDVDAAEKKNEELYAQIGRLQMELEWLKKKSGR